MKKVILGLLISCSALANPPSTRWIIELRDLDARLFGNDVCEPIQRTEHYISTCKSVHTPIKGFYVYGKIKNAYGQAGYCYCLKY